LFRLSWGGAAAAVTGRNVFAAATAPRCKEGFTDRGGLTLRTVACLSALKRFDGLFNLTVLTTTVDHPTQGVQGRLDAVAVDFEDAQAFRNVSTLNELSGGLP